MRVQVGDMSHCRIRQKLVYFNSPSGGSSCHKSKLSSLFSWLSPAHVHFAHGQQDALRINSEGYYENGGVNVMLFDDFYPEGHQGGLTIVQAGRRIAANGDVRLEPTPGQWSPVPRVGQRMVDTAKGVIDRYSLVS